MSDPEGAITLPTPSATSFVPSADDTTISGLSQAECPCIPGVRGGVNSAEADGGQFLCHPRKRSPTPTLFVVAVDGFCAQVAPSLLRCKA